MVIVIHSYYGPWTSVSVKVCRIAFSNSCCENAKHFSRIKCKQSAYYCTISNNWAFAVSSQLQPWLDSKKKTGKHKLRYSQGLWYDWLTYLVGLGIHFGGAMGRTLTERLVQRKWSVRKIEAKEEDSPTFITIMSSPLHSGRFYFQFNPTVSRAHSSASRL